MSTQLLVSVVVIGRNEGPRLRRCLDSIRAMRLPAGSFEIVYVDSDSTDGSPAEAEAGGARVCVVRPERPAAAIGRNAGWRTAAAPFVLFLDGDTVLDPDFVATSLPLFDDATVAVVSGHRRELYPERSLYNRVLDLDWIGPAGEADFCGGDALIRRDALAAVDGYDETLIAGEEPDMCTRMRQLGWRILRLDCPMTGHDLAMTRWSQYWRRAVRTGHAYAEVSARYRASATPLWQAEAHANWVRAPILLALPLTGLAGSLLLRSPLPALVVTGLLALLALRSARRFAWKSTDWLTLILYGVHSHLQQIPIYWGQLTYWRHRRAGRRQRLIEYKGDSA